MSQTPFFDFIGVGGIAYDMVLRLDELPARDDKYFVQQFDRLPGGLVANTTVAAAKLGLSCGFVGSIGDDSGGDLLLNAFKQDQVDTQALLKIPDEETPFTIIMVDKAGQRAILLPSFPLYHREITEPQIAYIRQGKYIYTHFRDLGRFTKLVAARDHTHNHLVLDVESNNALDKNTLIEIAQQIDILFIPQATIEQFGIQHIQEVKTRLWTIITSGSQGATGYNVKNDRLFHQPAYTVKAMDTTGAGDVFHAACITAHHQGKNLAQALQFGSAAAAIAVQHHGARGGLSTTEQVNDWIKAQS